MRGVVYPFFDFSILFRTYQPCVVSTCFIMKRATMKQIILLVMLGVPQVAASVRGYADRVCMPLDELNAALVDWYGETLVGGPGENKERLWMSAGTGTWTTALIAPDGNACVTGQGEGWTGAPVLTALQE
tara:strand:- start:1049 stop:1438 length:390 start_codon:yes stop_codon:yes gene_type:complete